MPKYYITDNKNKLTISVASQNHALSHFLHRYKNDLGDYIYINETGFDSFEYNTKNIYIVNKNDQNKHI